MKKAIPVLIALVLIVLVLGGIFGLELAKKYTPSKDFADLTEIYEASGDKTAIIYNYDLQEVKGIYANGLNYLPLSWVNANLNKRFYWDKNERMLVYALPDQIVYAKAETTGSNGAPLLLVKDDDIYLTVGLIVNYTDVQISVFDTDEVKRVYVTDWGTREMAMVNRNGKVRVRGGIKSPIVTEVYRDDLVTVLEQMESWSKVMTPDGHIGYIQNKIMAESKPQELSGSFEQLVYNGTSLDEKIVLAWHQVTSQAANQTLEGYLEKTEGINVISPTWFSLTDNEGNFESLASRSYVQKAHEMGIQVWALLDNFSGDVQTEVLLSSTTTRRRLVDALITAAEEYELDGLNMDFESLKPEAGVHYIQFLRELSIPCREKGIVLSVDNYVPAGYNEFYDRREQGIVADYVIIMGYDEHYAGGDAGSVASMPYVTRGIERTLEDVPKEKVINGVPFYTRMWTESGDGLSSSAMGISESKKWISDNEVELTWLEDVGQYYGECETSKGFQYLWLEEETSLELKMDLIKSYDLAGVACWKLGLEDEAAWTAINWD